MADLTGRQIEELRSGLQKVFPDWGRLEMFLREQVDRRLNHYAGNDPLPRAIFRVVEGAEAEGWLNELVLAAYRARPNRPEIAKVATELGLVVFEGDLGNERPWAGGVRDAAICEYQAIVNLKGIGHDPAILRKMLVEFPARVCKMEIPGGGGTGFLVGPDLVLTNYHVMEPICLNAARAADVVCRFDYSKKDDGTPVGEHDGLVCQLALPNWCVAKGDKSPWDETQQGPEPTVDQLDYCLIRLTERIGEGRLRDSTDTQVDRRGWLAMDRGQQAGVAGQELFILQHPDGASLKFTIGDHRGFNSNQNRFYYDINTQKGSSGSPVFNAHLELVGLHNSGWKDAGKLVKEGRKANQGIPISNIAAKIFDRFPQFPSIPA